MVAAKRRCATSSSSRRFDFSSKSGTKSSRRLNAVVDPGSSLDEFVELSSASSSDDGSIRCSIDGDDFTVSKAEMEAERLRKKMASMGGEMLRDPKDFVSTDGQRLQCAVHFGVCSLLAMRGLYLDAVVMDGDVVGLAARAFATVFASYVLADLGTGIFHWSVDNYGDKNTPVAGNVIDAFQGHHRWPWTITKRQWANNIHKTCIAPLFFTVPQLLVFGGSDMQGSGDSDLFFGSFWALVVLSQQTHAWAHMKPSDQPKIVTKLQDMNLMLTRKDHGAHHRSPFEGHYCIINGWWNPLLDDSHFFRKLERVIYERTGVAPRCWTEDDFEVEEDAPDGFGQGVL
jgi:ubiquitin-conjugating enzyme E2 variant